MQISMLLHCFFVVVLFSLQQVPSFAARKHYIVYLGSHHAEPRLLDNPESVTNTHHELISSVLMSGEPSDRIIYSFNKIFNGFSANLHEEEANELAKHPNVVSVFESRPVNLAITRSPDFLELTTQHKEASQIDSIWEKASLGEDMIIANIDSGVWPESKSFSDEGLGPIPPKFKGACDNQHDPTFKCNRKLIGARYLHKGIAEEAALQHITFNQTLSPRDDIMGHGTHTLSTAGGSFVPGANYGGLANGTARGMAPKARVVAYKVMWPNLLPSGSSGSDADIMAAYESAMDDNVDIINLSMGTPATDYIVDAIAISSFHAMKNGILTVAAASNDGPVPGSVTNVAPWLLTVAASSIDRAFYCDVILGNNYKIKGIAAHDIFVETANKVSYCQEGTLDAEKVKGKIVVCYKTLSHGISDEETKKSDLIREIEGVGMLLTKEEGKVYDISTEEHVIPTATLSYNDSKTLYAYISSTRTPTATITLPTTSLEIKPAPVMADFSSRGPNAISPSILKPDVTAPGVNILGAHPPEIANSSFLLGSGTSMAAPHMAGIAALIKKLHPDWTSAAIKSAIMTTANPLDSNGMPILDYDQVTKASPFAYGAGHVRPNLAMDPGLVYDMNPNDYLNFLCAHMHKSTISEAFSKQHSYECPPSLNILDFNYPSITIPEFTGQAIVTRTLKNVAQPSTYIPRIEAPQGISIVVEPKTLVFSNKDQNITFKLVFTADVNHLPNDYVFGSLIWSDAKHVVRSPIVVKAKKK
ncbi:hypothetical protein BVRB_8g196790 [Beta vulgaris subsp. vulgaris]|nr:hypothetical protein BVRB_8g196790 [Beta vulgaris subsp. vulgaris]